MPPSHKTITAAAMTTNKITSLRELLHYRERQIVQLKILFSFKCDQWGQKKATPDVVSIKQLKASLGFGLSSIIVYPKGQHSFLSSYLLSSVSSRFFYFHCFFSRSTLPNSLLSNTLLPRRSPSNTADSAYRNGLCTSGKYMPTKQEEDVFSTFLPFCSEKWKPAHDKNMKHENSNSFDVFV